MNRKEFLKLFRKHLKIARRSRKWDESRALGYLVSGLCPFVAGLRFVSGREKLFEEPTYDVAAKYYARHRHFVTLTNPMLKIMEE